ncbi:NRXN2 [Branchiostoma lanceolatum]|uniref:NRXN2 protein n=1 Tax=Branchiostoma lanceolatum TaxID=7740 RepID=A0A8K0EUE8_BRALA|nr:NRXN2 [Branchiostoma lanceolatum]
MLPFVLFFLSEILSSHQACSQRDDSLVSTTYEFGPAGGLITYEFPNEARPNTRIDMLAVGFTTRVTQAVLVRIDSATSDDFMEIMINDGLLVATYNMGTQDHPVSEKSKKVNDGSYHIVRFSRIGANASLQLDNLPLNEKKPPVPSYLSSEDRSKQLSVFNSQAYIRLGGRSSNGRSRRGVDKPYFVGMLSGFYYNDIKVLDLARQKDPRVKVEGDVKAVKPPSMPTRVPPLPVPPQPRKPVPPSDEDDILVMSGSGCQSDDEDDCDPSLGSVGGKGEEGIITPIINGQPTPKPPKPPKSTPIVPVPSDGPGPDSCDDEDDPDCDDGSGSGDGSGTTTASTDAVRFSVTTTTGGRKQTTPPTLQPSPPLQPGLTPNTVAGPRGNGQQILPTNGVSNVIPPLFPKQPNGKPSNIITLEPGNGKSPVQNPVQEQQVADTASTTGMVVGIVVAAAIALLILLYAMYKYRNRDEGSYRIDESRNYNFHTSGLPAQQNGSVPKEKPHKPVKKKDSKEWYV